MGEEQRPRENRSTATERNGNRRRPKTAYRGSEGSKTWMQKKWRMWAASQVRSVTLEGPCTCATTHAINKVLNPTCGRSNGRNQLTPPFCASNVATKGSRGTVTGSKWRYAGAKIVPGKPWVAFGIKAHAKCVSRTRRKKWQEGTQGVWQKEPPYKEELELVKRSNDLGFGGLLLRRVNNAGRPSDWESFKEEF